MCNNKFPFCRKDFSQDRDDQTNPIGRTECVQQEKISTHTGGFVVWDEKKNKRCQIMLKAMLLIIRKGHIEGYFI